ncbi:MAG: UDP-N-acetylmuramoyl-tripeptide--D-alanyl-D-alanine ligase [Fibrobacteraceae bacterium]
MLKPDLTVAEMCEILEASPVGVPARAMKRKVQLCLDSREASKNVVFWPLKGARFDAHDFIPQVMGKGALMSVVNKNRVDSLQIEAYVPVDDTAKALQRLAKGYQRRFHLKKVAVTGSNGKTTTKEMLKAILSRKFKTFATPGNLNNQLGVPMTLLQLKREHEVAVVEMGTSGPGEIRPLSMITEPDIAVITNIGASHLEGLGSLDGVFKEKICIAEGLRRNGILVLNADDAHLCKVRSTKTYRVVTFGIRRGVYKPVDLKWDMNACANFKIGRTQFHLGVPGIHNVYNALAAIAVADALRIPKAEMATALENFHAANMRMEIRKADGFKIVSDCYNANPSSTRMALETVGSVEGFSRRIAVLGDMLELGRTSADLHRDMGRLVPEMNFNCLLTVGKDAKNIQAGAIKAGMRPEHALHFDDVQGAIDFLNANVRRGDILLVKGSRGMKLERVVEAMLRLTPVDA